MFKRPSKKQQLIERIVVSVMAVLTVAVIVTITILFTLGYRLDSDSGRLEQGALLQFDSKPNNADVWIDGVHTGSRTGSKKMVVAGEHSIIFSKDGYHDWTRSVNLVAGTLTWLDYVRLIPKELPVKSVATYKTVEKTLSSPDNKFYVVQENSSLPKLTLVDLRSEDVKTNSIDLPLSLIEGGSLDTADDKIDSIKYNIIRWDQGSRYLIANVTQSDKKEWIIIDTQDASASRNVTRALSVGLVDIDFVGNDGRTLYGLLDDGTLRKLDLGGQTISRALVSKVSSFSVNPDTKVVGYNGVDPSDEKRSIVGVYKDGDSSGYILRGTTTDAPLMISATSYHGSDYFAVSEGGSVSVLKGNYPRSVSEVEELAVKDSFKLDGPVKALSFSDTGRFLVAQSDASYVGYEVEHGRASDLQAKEAKTDLEWLDVAYLWNASSETLRMRDFNGSNVYDIMKFDGRFDVTLSQNGRFVYSVAKSENGFSLQRVKLILS